MTRFPALYHMLTGKLPETPAIAAARARQAAMALYESAVRANDTRKQHEAYVVLKAVTTEALGLNLSGGVASSGSDLSPASRSHTLRQAGGVRT